jgi:hypothetical protein
MDRPSIMLCRVIPGSGSRSFAFPGFGDELRILQPFQESRFHGAHAVARIPGGMATAARNYSA